MGEGRKELLSRVLLLPSLKLDKVSTQKFRSDAKPFSLSKGGSLKEVEIAYETWGSLNSDKSNVVLVFHALSGSQHAAGLNTSVDGIEDLWTEEMHVGWWSEFIGSGLAIDTDKYFVICMNYLGGCYGSTGPASINPDTGKPYGADFPEISVSDIVESQKMVLESLGVSKLHGLVGASVGGLCALNFACRYPDFCNQVMIIGSGCEVSTLQRLHNLEQIRAIEADELYAAGNYYGGEGPWRGLSLARMIAHKTYISLQTLTRRANRDVVNPEVVEPGIYQVSHPVESYMRHHCLKFVKRFDANTYLRIATAWQSFDLLTDTGAKSYKDVFSKCKGLRFSVFSIDSDVCFYPGEQAELVARLKEADVDCKHITVHSEKGHDAFLLEPDLFAPYLQYELSGSAAR